MKYIKMFESQYGKYWKVSLSSPEYEISINKIGLHNKKRFENKLVLFKGLYPDSKFFYISEESYPSFIENDHSKFPFPNLSFMGNIEVTKEEIDEWNFEHDAEKYNL